jgi:hypothetical protein
MVAFNFKAQFADDVESGKKRQTIRQQRRARLGDRLQLYTGMRTKKCRKLRDAECMDVVPLMILSDSFGRLRVVVDGKEIRGGRLDAFVTADGFARRMDMRDFFADQYGLPFLGWLIRWA